MVLRKPAFSAGKVRHYLSGNEAAAEGAIAAGCGFYAGYPITPSSELMERMSVRLTETGGVFIQMEDELASICSVLGASWAGAKAMTATSGPVPDRPPGLGAETSCRRSGAPTEIIR
jgi:TPP-dependent indolepyruvate ferredoxin oxidoreductase alpha subunit